jgi:2-polyprenyl-6-methoxyphenol hydroxylase-like FAD-dependent oxidoreductase
MARVVMVGSGIVGLCTGMLLQRDGHDVTLLERDPAPPPADPRDAWAGWERRGINQFRLPHYFQPRFRQLLDEHLPDVSNAMREAGALPLHVVKSIPDEFTGGPREGDDELVALTGRRPVIEGAVADAALAAGLDVRRGVAVAGLLAEDGADGVPHVIGVRTEDGAELRADLVIDSSGRRSPCPKWLEAIGSAPPDDQADDLGFAYYGRHLRSSDGSTPPALGPPLQHYESISTLTLPADNGTWCVALVTAGNDAPLRAIRDVDTWTRVFASYPMVAHWLDGEPLEDHIISLSKIEDRHRSLVVDDSPVVTGLLLLGDAWACTNPSVGRGASIGLTHGVALRDTLRSSSVDDPGGLAKAFHAATLATVEPWYHATVDMDRQRMAEVQASIAGSPVVTDDTYELTNALLYSIPRDPDLLRVGLRMMSLLSPADEWRSDPALVARIREIGGGWRDDPMPGPSRAELLALLDA